MKVSLQAVLKALDGNKTYIGAIGYGLLGVFWSQGWISDDNAKLVAGLLTAWSGFAIKSAIVKSSPVDPHVAETQKLWDANGEKK